MLLQTLRIGAGLFALLAGCDTYARARVEGRDLLTEKTRSSIEFLITEHEKLTGEEIIIHLVEQAPEPEAYAAKIFEKLTDPLVKQENRKSLLLVAFKGNQHVEILPSLNLSVILEDSVRKDLQSVFENLMNRTLQGGDAFDRAVHLILYHVISHLQSPLIQSGQEILALDSEALEELAEDELSMPTAFFFVLVFVGFGSLLSVLFLALSREYHIHSEGEYHLTILDRVLLELKHLRARISGNKLDTEAYTHEW